MIKAIQVDRTDAIVYALVVRSAGGNINLCAVDNLLGAEFNQPEVVSHLLGMVQLIEARKPATEV